MKFYLVLSFLLLLSLCSGEQHQQQQQNETSLYKEKNCKYDLLPGLLKMERGIDLNRLDLFPMGSESSDTFTKANGWMESVFSFACQNDDTWVNPTDENKVYTLPDEVENVFSNPSGQLDSSVDMSSSMQETKNSLEGQTDVDASFAGIGFSASYGYQIAKTSILQSNKIVSLTKGYQSTYDIELQDSISFSESFTKALKKLPATYNENPNAYEDLMNRFGTHYFSIARFGGSLVLRTEFESSYVENELSATVKAKLSTTFLSISKTNVDAEAKAHIVDSQFDSHSSSSFHYFGGHTDVALDSRVSDWFKTVALDPWLFSGKLVSIDKAIMKQEEVADKAEEVRKAILIKLAKSTLADLEKSIEMSENIKSKVESSEESLELLTQVRDYFREDKKEFESTSEVEENIEKLRKVLKNSKL